MKKLISFMILIGMLSLTTPGEAQQSQDFGNYVVHYNSLNTDMLLPQVAKGYGIQRSSSRALLNITVLKKNMDNSGTPVKASVTASGTNLTGQRREIDIREIKDTEGAIYYIGEFTVHNMETYNFTVNVRPEDEADPVVVKFRQQFYTE
jgi:hypothetical protein